MFTLMTGFLASLSTLLYLNNVVTTAASFGARKAAVEGTLADAQNSATGVSNIKTSVKNFVSASSGLSLSNSDVTVTGPTGTYGDRTVTVNIQKVIDSPIKIQTLLNNMQGHTSPPNTDKITIGGAATMHYEE